MLNDVISRNYAALDAIDEHEVYQAQTLFRENAKRSPCFMTINNLGVFHIFEGLLKSDNSGHGATKLGISYLKKAENYQKSNLTLLAYGFANFETKQYGDAYERFKQACELKEDYNTVYNCGTSIYMTGSYHDAAIWFNKALSLCSSDDYYDTFISYLFSLLYSNKKEFLSTYKKLLTMNYENMEWEKFIFSYFADDLHLTENLIEPVLKNYCVGHIEMSIIFDCLYKFGKGEKSIEYLQKLVEYFEGFEYNTQPEISHIKRAFAQADYRIKLITEYRHSISIIKQCCYYGCKNHNPL
ncbi:MAG: hypothetical protein VB118_10340 [Oscillospiraceae bacterium]|nr:hypothetical protein [Oscillospiraceae bacterium]